MPAQLLGAHMPTGKGLADAIRRGKEIGCTAVQVFTNNPRQWKGKTYTDQETSEFLAARSETGIGDAVVSHDTYLINLCAPDVEIRAKSRAALLEEMHRCAGLRIPFVVSHIGAPMKQGEAAGIALAGESLRELLPEFPADTTLLMETTAGQGSSLNHRFEQLASLLEEVKGHRQVAVCLDTCHIFAAGYDIRTAEGFDQVLEEFARIVGLDRLKVIHCNDSKKALGTRVDRHEHIGEGEIGADAFRFLVKDARLERVPILLETPDAPTMHGENLARLLSFRTE